MTLRAFIRNSGNHGTPTKPRQSWNVQFTQASTRQVLSQYDTFLKKQEALVDDMQDEMMQVIEDMLKQLHSKVDMQNFEAR